MFHRVEANMTEQGIYSSLAGVRLDLNLDINLDPQNEQQFSNMFSSFLVITTLRFQVYSKIVRKMSCGGSFADGSKKICVTYVLLALAIHNILKIIDEKVLIYYLKTYV